MVERIPAHGGGVARSLRRKVAAVAHRHRVLEVLVQVVDILDHAVFKAAANPDVIEDGQVLHVFAEADPAGVRADRYAAFSGHEEHGEDLVDAA